MSATRALLCSLAVLAVAACDDEAAVTDPQASPGGPEFAKGGQKGPPSSVVTPIPPGLTRLPKAFRPGAGPPSFLSQIIDVEAGNRFSCALRSDGLAYCWGSALLGDGSSVGSSVPVEVSGPNRFVRLEAGDQNACGLTALGEAWCWGDNSQGQLGAGSSAPFSLVPVAVAGGHRFTDLNVGLRNMCGVATDGLTYCWGSNNSGQLGNGSAGGPVNVPVAVVNSGTLGFVSVSIGFFNTCGLVASGQVYCWGRQSGFGNGSSTPTVVPTPTLAASGASFASVSAGTQYACGVDAAGAAACWGSQLSGELGTGLTTVAALTPTAVVGGLSFAGLDASDNNSFISSTCGVTTAGEGWCWGSNQFGQLGAASSGSCTFNTTFACSPSPVRVSGGLTLTDIAVGAQHACAVDQAGNVWCWGGNTGGELGDGTMVNSGAPVQVAGLLVSGQNGWIEITPLPTQPLRLIGETQQLTAVALDESGVPLAVQPTFTWTSSNPAAATVGPTGLVTAVATGGTTITAAASGLTGRVGLGVQIVDPVALFRDAWAGGSSAGVGPSDGVVVLGGLLADEWAHSGTFPTRSEVDQRSIATTNATVDQVFSRLAFARIALEHDAARLGAANPGDPAVGQLLTLAGYVYLAFAENFCSGVPLDDPNTGESTSVLFNLALARFNAARSGPIVAPFDDVARVGMARAYLGLGNLAAAGTMAQAVPTAFSFGTTHASVSGQENQVWALSPQQRRLSVADVEGGTGLPFRTAADARVSSTFVGIGFDGITPTYVSDKYPTAASSIVLASGIEARLIEAEAALASGNVSGMTGLLGTLLGQTVADPGLPALREDLLFRERAFWMFATGQRLGDLRRLIGQYGRTPASLFPGGSYPKGGVYGSDANLPVPSSARGPGYADCTNRGS